MINKIKEVLSGRYHSLNADDFNQLVLFKDVMLYFQGQFGLKELPLHYYYLFVPILEVFKDVYLKSRPAQLLVYLITFIERMQQAAIPIFDMR